MNNQKEIKLKMSSSVERERMILALANSGYKCRVVIEENNHSISENYYVVFELKGQDNET